VQGKSGDARLEELRALVERGHPDLSVRLQCELLGVNRTGLYYEPVGESEENLLLMRLLDEQYTRAPFYGRCLYSLKTFTSVVISQNSGREVFGPPFGNIPAQDYVLLM